MTNGIEESEHVGDVDPAWLAGIEGEHVRELILRAYTDRRSGPIRQRARIRWYSQESGVKTHQAVLAGALSV